MYRRQDMLGNWWLLLSEEAHSMATQRDSMVFFGSTCPEIKGSAWRQQSHYKTIETTYTYNFNYRCDVVELSWYEIDNSCNYGTEYTVSGRLARSLVWRNDYKALHMFKNGTWHDVTEEYGKGY